MLDSALLGYKPYAAFGYAFNAEKDYYRILGVSQGATHKEIKAAYYKLAKRYHPDVNKGREELFKQIADAYSIIGEEKNRNEYDSARKFSKGTGFRASQSHYYRQRSNRGANRAGSARYSYNNYYDQSYQGSQQKAQYERYYNYYGESNRRRSRAEQEEDMRRNYYSRFYGTHFHDFEEFIRQMNEKMRQHEAYEGGNRSEGSAKRSWSDRRNREQSEARSREAENLYRKQMEEEFRKMQDSMKYNSGKLNETFREIEQILDEVVMGLKLMFRNLLQEIRQKHPLFYSLANLR